MGLHTSRPEQWQNQIKKLEEKRENNVNRYIIPIEIKIEEIKDKLKKHYSK